MRGTESVLDVGTAQGYALRQGLRLQAGSPREQGTALADSQASLQEQLADERSQKQAMQQQLEGSQACTCDA